MPQNEKDLRLRSSASGASDMVTAAVQGGLDYTSAQLTAEYLR